MINARNMNNINLNNLTSSVKTVTLVLKYKTLQNKHTRLTFWGLCTVIYACNKVNKVHCFSTLFWNTTLHVSDKLTAHYQVSWYCIHNNWYLSFYLYWLSASEVRSQPRQQTVNINSMTNTNCCKYSIKTPDDGQSETCRVVYQNKVKKLCTLLAFIVQITTCNKYAATYRNTSDSTAVRSEVSSNDAIFVFVTMHSHTQRQNNDRVANLKDLYVTVHIKAGWCLYSCITRPYCSNTNYISTSWKTWIFHVNFRFILFETKNLSISSVHYFGADLAYPAVFQGVLTCATLNFM
jgi:hypothetical protein